MPWSRQGHYKPHGNDAITFSIFLVEDAVWVVSPGTSKTFTFEADEIPLHLVYWPKPRDLAIDNVSPLEVK